MYKFTGKPWGAEMDDTAIKNALARRDRLAKEIEQHEQAIKAAKADLDRVARFIEAWFEFASEEDIRGLGPVSDVPVMSAMPKKHANPKKENVAEISAEIIREAGRPMSRTELFNALAEKGVRIRGKDPKMVLSTMLWRMRDKIVRLQPQGYWVADTPYPQAGYDPNEPYDPKAKNAQKRSLLD